MVDLIMNFISDHFIYVYWSGVITSAILFALLLRNNLKNGHDITLFELLSSIGWPFASWVSAFAFSAVMIMQNETVVIKAKKKRKSK